MARMAAALILLLASVPAQSQSAMLPPDLFIWSKAGSYNQDFEITMNAGRKLMRFTSAIANRGPGPFELHGEVSPDGTTRAFQRIYLEGGGFQEREAGTFAFSGHAGHNHFHYEDFASYRLRAVASGDRLGAVVRTSEKVSFAMWDVAPYDRSLPNAPRDAVYNRPVAVDPANQTQGISVGWADIYDRTLEDQDVDVTGLPDGVYWLENQVDPRDRLVESNEANNFTWVKVSIEGMVAQALPGQPTQGTAPGPVPRPIAALPAPYPNPWRQASNAGSPMRFGPLVSGEVVDIFALNGQRIRSLSAGGTEAGWDLRNESGQPVASGAYFYLVRGKAGIKRRGRLAVLR